MTIRFCELPDLIGGAMNDPYEPDQILTLEKVDVRTVVGGAWNQPLASVSAAEWQDPSFYEMGSYWDEFYEDEKDRIETYPALEEALRRGDEIPPLVLQENKEGQLVVVDGWHRITIALYVGRHELWAYVAPPEADWNG